MKTYYVHSIYGDRYDGTHYLMDWVESVEENEALMTNSDTKTEFYTENHRYFFRGTKKACEEMAEANNAGARERGICGSAECGEITIDGEKYYAEYDYKKKTKIVYYRERCFGGVKISMETGEVIDESEEIKNARKLIEEHDKLVNALTKKKEEEAV